MKAKLIFDGVYELPTLPASQQRVVEDYPSRVSVHSERLEAIAEKIGGGALRSNHIRTRHGQGGAEEWHIDCSPESDIRTSTGGNFLLVMIACDIPDPELGTEVLAPDGTTFHCKPWTPYLLRWDIIHRAAQKRWNADVRRFLYRFYVAIDEASLA